jgi:hypothetical protein
VLNAVAGNGDSATRIKPLSAEKVAQTLLWIFTETFPRLAQSQVDLSKDADARHARRARGV